MRQNYVIEYVLVLWGFLRLFFFFKWHLCEMSRLVD